MKQFLSQSIRSRSIAAALGSVATLTLTFLAPLSASIARAELTSNPKAVLDEAWQIVNRDYVDGSFNQLDWQAVREQLLSRDYSSPESAYTALRQALSQLNDPYTRFLDPAQFAALTEQTTGELSGIGLRLQRNESLSILSVIEPLPNSPALRAGLRANDHILEIDGQSTRQMSVEAAANLIRGEVGSPVTLKIRRGAESTFEVTLLREAIELPAVERSVKVEGDSLIGYIRLKEFSSHAHEQMYRAIQDLKDQNVDAFVLDLRGNPGGLLDVSVQIARMWLDDGMIVQTVDRQGHVEKIEATNTAITDRPLAVLVDGNSASASEILAGALRDNRRATLVGSQTFGKALVQSVNSLSDGSGLAVTVAHYYTPNGTDISHRGIAPDIRIDLTAEQKLQLSINPERLGTLEDPFYVQAVSMFIDAQPIASQAKTMPTLNRGQP